MSPTVIIRSGPLIPSANIEMYTNEHYLPCGTALTKDELMTREYPDANHESRPRDWRDEFTYHLSR